MINNNKKKKNLNGKKMQLNNILQIIHYAIIQQGVIRVLVKYGDIITS